MLYLLCMAANYPRVLQVLLQDLEETLRIRHGQPIKLKEFMQNRCNYRNSDSPIPSEWRRVEDQVRTTVLVTDELTLDSIGSDQLRLVRSFSFVGEAGLNPGRTSSDR